MPGLRARPITPGLPHFGVAGLRARNSQAGLRARLPPPQQPRPQLTRAHPLRRHETHKPPVQQRDVAKRIARHRAETIARPFFRIQLNIAPIGLQLLLRRHKPLPIVALPGRGAHIHGPPGRAQIAIDLRDPSLEPPDHVAQLVLAVILPLGNPQDGMEMVRHHHELNDLRARVPVAQRAQRLGNGFPEHVQLALRAHDRAENRLVERRLDRHEKRAV